MGLRVIIFEVESGSSAFIKTPTRNALLIDCGCSADFSPALYLDQHELQNVVEHNGRKLTSLTITHPDGDSVADLETVMRTCPPAMIHRQRYDWQEIEQAKDGGTLQSYSKWQQAFRQRSSPPDLGMDVRRFGLTPAEARKVDYTSFVDNSSLVVTASFKGTEVEEKFLFGSNVGEAGWNALLQNSDFRSAIQNTDFFIASRHGHPSGFSAALFEAMGNPPILNVVSSSRSGQIDDRYGMEQYARGKKLPDGGKQRMWNTSVEGSILISIDDTGRYKLATEHLKPNRTRSTPAKA